MPVVIADTGPLNYLLLIGEIEVLPRLFGAVCVPAGVQAELGDPNAPPPVRQWISQPPPWLTVHMLSAPAPRRSRGTRPCCHGTGWGAEESVTT